MIIVSRIFEQEKMVELVSEEYDLSNRIALSKIPFGSKNEIEIIKAEKNKRAYKLKENAYVRTDTEFSKVIVDGVEFGKDQYSIMPNGAVIFNTKISEGKEFIVEYMHDNDREIGLALHSWMLLNGNDVEHGNIKENKLEIKKKSVINNIEKCHFYLYRKNSNFPLKLTSENIVHQKTGQNMMVYVRKLGCGVRDNDVLIVSRCGEVCYLPPVNTYVKLFLMKKD